MIFLSFFERVIIIFRFSGFAAFGELNKLFNNLNIVVASATRVSQRVRATCITLHCKSRITCFHFDERENVVSSQK